MFPYQKSCELSFQTSDAVGDQEQDNNVEDLILLDNNAPLIRGNNTTNRSGRGRGRGRVRGRGRGRNPSSLATNYSSNNANNNEGDDDNERRIIHREVERHRRQEMSNLYTSLRAALPAEYIKGKRAISEHIAETVKYIKDLEKNVKELGERRDLLRGSSSQEGVNINEAGGSSNSFLPGTVVIRPCVGGLEIEISVSCEDDGFLLSSAIQVVLEEGVGVTSCSSTRISDERLIHSLQCEVTDTTCIDVNRLQQRLIDLVY